jgi:preprotein translocase subunit SecY
LLEKILDIFYNISKKLPVIKGSEKPLSSKEKLQWTVIVLLLYYMLFNTTAIGLKEHRGEQDFIQLITASRQGSLLALGIGPIVIAGIVIQLFAGGGLINLDFNDPETRKKITGATTTFAILVAIFEAFMYTINYANIGIFTIAVNNLSLIIVALQLALGAIIIIYLDQIITKYGIGNGISLFIAAGVSYGIISGVSFTFFSENGIINTVAEGGIEGLTNALVMAIPLLSTLLIFWLTVKGESAKISLPLSIPGINRALELPFFFVSNLPVIFASALLVYIFLLSTTLLSTPIKDKYEWQHYLGGILYLFTPVSAGSNIPAYIAFLTQGKTPVYGLPEWLHAITYVIALCILSIFFGKFWVEMNPQQNPENIAKAIVQAGIQIKGHRSDPRLITSRLSEYIWPLTITGSLAVGLLAAFGDLLAVYGTGTGILLTVGILYKMSNEVKSTLDVHYPALSKLIFKSQA